MSNSKEIVPCGSAWSPEFIQELLPSAQRVALLYHLSYLCLAGFPKLERLLRSRALETQLIFGSSEALLLKCIGTSDNMVTTLFPMLKTAVTKNKPMLAVKFLEKAKAWINQLIIEVDQIVQRYHSHNNDVSTTTSDVITEKDETEKKIQINSEELKVIEKRLEEDQKKLSEIAAQMMKKDEEITATEHELERLVGEISRRNSGLGILSAMVPFVGAIISSVVKTVKDPGDKARTQALQNQVQRLRSDKNGLKDDEWKVQNERTNWQMKAATLKINLGSIPSPEHLNEVQTCLSRIQQILVQLQKFWEKIGSLLETLKEKTFAGEDMIDYLDDVKEEFLDSICTAQVIWKRFGAVCAKANGIFSVQAKDAYKFLEINPTSLSKEEWQRQYDAVNEKLKNIHPLVNIEESNTEEQLAVNQ